MRTTPHAFLPLAAAAAVVLLGLNPLAAAEKAAAAPAADETVALDSLMPTVVSRGHTRDEVLKALATPDYRISGDIWVYWNCSSISERDNARGYNTLVVSFANGCVTNIRLVTRASLEALIARLEANRLAAQRVAAN